MGQFVLLKALLFSKFFYPTRQIWGPLIVQERGRVVFPSLRCDTHLREGKTYFFFLVDIFDEDFQELTVKFLYFLLVLTLVSQIKRTFFWQEALNLA